MTFHRSKLSDEFALKTAELPVSGTLNSAVVSAGAFAGRSKAMFFVMAADWLLAASCETAV